MAVDLSKIENLYTENIKKHGIDAKSVGWGTIEKQNLRFEKLLQVIQDAGSSPFTLNELGCGYGELVKYCDTNNYSLDKYDGYDISEEMLKKAEEYIGRNTVSLHHASTLSTQADYTVASGIFNVKFDTDAESWDGYIKTTISHMWERSERGIAFNGLTKYVDYEAENLYYTNPLELFDFCKKQLGRKVNLIHDYDLFEFTIHIVK